MMWWLLICFIKQNHITIAFRHNGHAIFVQYSAYLFHFCGKCLNNWVSSFQSIRLPCFYITVGLYITKDFTKRHRKQHLKCRFMCVICGCRLFFPHSGHILCALCPSCLSPSQHLRISSLTLSFLFILGYHTLPSSANRFLTLTHPNHFTWSHMQSFNWSSTANYLTTTLLPVLLFPALA